MDPLYSLKGPFWIPPYKISSFAAAIFMFVHRVQLEVSYCNYLAWNTIALLIFDIIGKMAKTTELVMSSPPGVHDMFHGRDEVKIIAIIMRREMADRVKEDQSEHTQTRIRPFVRRIRDEVIQKYCQMYEDQNAQLWR